MKQYRALWGAPLLCSAALIALSSLAHAQGAQTGRAIDKDQATASDFSSKGKGHAKGHAKKYAKQGYGYKHRGANSPYFCPPGQAKKPGLGSAHMC